MYDNIRKCHQRVGHSRCDKTWGEACKNYAWIRREAVGFFLQTCPDCSVRVPVKKAKATKPIIFLGFLRRVQVDSIDMSSQPDGDYKWILHARDHFSKFSWTFPLTPKRAAEVAEKLTMLFRMFGPPKILQSDNGREFVASVINNITTLWPGLLIIHGSVIGSDLTTGENDPFEDPLQVGQFVAWKLDELSEEIDMETPHRKIRKQARDNYLETARHSQIQ